MGTDVRGAVELPCRSKVPGAWAGSGILQVRVVGQADRCRSSEAHHSVWPSGSEVSEVPVAAPLGTAGCLDLTL